MHTFQPLPFDLVEFNPFTKIGKEWALVTAGNKEEMLNISVLNCINNLIGNGKHSAVSKACHYLISAVYSGKALFFCISAKLKGFFDNRYKIVIFADMHHSRIANRIGSKHSVCI